MIDNFDVLKAMSLANGKIQIAPLGNVTGARYTKKGTLVTIGVAGNVVGAVLKEEFIGGLILADKEEFDRVKLELESKEAS